MSLDEFFYQVLQGATSLECDTQHALNVTLSMMSKLLSYPEIDGNHPQDRAFATLRNWLRTECRVEAKQDQGRIATFYAVCEIYKQFKENLTALQFTGLLSKEEMGSWHQFFNDFFMAYVTHSGAPPIVNFEKFAPLREKIKRAKLDPALNQIESFFDTFFSRYDLLGRREISEDQQMEIKQLLCEQYALLRDPAFQKRVQVADQWILDIERRNTSLEGSGNTARVIREVSIYEFNRYFLHALIVSPEEWTPLFASQLRQILDFLKNHLAQAQVNESVQRAYPPSLITQLEYFWACSQMNPDAEAKGFKQPKRPRNMLVLPEQVRSIDEWVLCASFLSEKERTSYYGTYCFQIDRMLLKGYGCDRSELEMYEARLSQYIMSLPKERRVEFIKETLAKGAEIVKLQGNDHLHSLWNQFMGQRYHFQRNTRSVDDYLGLSAILIALNRTGESLVVFNKQICTNLYHCEIPLVLKTIDNLLSVDSSLLTTEVFEAITGHSSKLDPQNFVRLLEIPGLNNVKMSYF